MLFKEKLKKLESSPIYKEWKEKNKKTFLAHIFISSDAPEIWQFGYYDKNIDKITTFVVNSEIQHSVSEQIFKKPGAIITELEKDKVKIEPNEALKIMEKLQKEKYKQATAMKSFMILQRLELGQVYNITYVTNSLSTLNVKMDSENGKILREKFSSLLGDTNIIKGKRR